MSWAPDSSLTSLVARLAGRRKDALAEQTQNARGVIANELSARGLLRSGQYIARLTKAYTDALREYAEGLASDLVEITQNSDGSLEPQAAVWIREQLEPNFEAMGNGVAKAIRDDRIVQKLPVDTGDDVLSSVIGLKRDLGIMLDKATLRGATSAKSEPMVDSALIDTLVPLRNRRAFDADLFNCLSAATAAAEPLALLAFDIDKFKSVNDDHGGHATGDEALLAIADISAACMRGKGTAYRLGGDEFALVLPNHSTQEAVGVAERLRRTVNETQLTSHGLRLSLSIGVAEFPIHGGDVGTLKGAADKAAYNAKDLGGNLVRIFGEPPPLSLGARDPERKQAEPGGLTENQRQRIREDHFRRGIANCPHDGAQLKVQDTTTMGQKTESIYVACPLCGLSEELR